MSSKSVNAKIYHQEKDSDLVLYALFQQLDKENLTKKQSITRLVNTKARIKVIEDGIKERLKEIKKK